MRRESCPTISVLSEEEQAERSAISFHVFLKKDETAKFNRLFALFSSVGYPDIDKGRCRDDIEYRHALADNLLTGQAAEIAKCNPFCPLSRFALRKKRELIYLGKAAVAVANHMLRIGLALIHHHDICCTAKENNCAKLKSKLAGYKLSALTPYRPR